MKVSYQCEWGCACLMSWSRERLSGSMDTSICVGSQHRSFSSSWLVRMGHLTSRPPWGYGSWWWAGSQRCAVWLSLSQGCGCWQLWLPHHHRCPHPCRAPHPCPDSGWMVWRFEMGVQMCLVLRLRWGNHGSGLNWWHPEFCSLMTVRSLNHQNLQCNVPNIVISCFPFQEECVHWNR